MLNSNNNNTLVSKSIPTLHTVLCTNSNNSYYYIFWSSPQPNWRATRHSTTTLAHITVTDLAHAVANSQHRNLAHDHVEAL